MPPRLALVTFASGLLLTACGEDDGGGGDSGTDSDADIDTDTDTDADTDTDTDASSDPMDDCAAMSEQCVVFVDGSLGDYADHDGSTWALALENVQEGLDAAAANVADMDGGLAGCAVWVVGGTYMPTADPDGDTDPSDARTKTVSLREDVALCGGFEGDEIAFDERVIDGNEALLSGDVTASTEWADGGDPDGGTSDGGLSDNAYHVVTGADRATIDGFTIAGGNADGDIPVESGGGMYSYGASPTVARCVFEGNRAASGGGGMFAHYSSPRIEKCSFLNNSAGRAGGGVLLGDGAPTLKQCIFEGNTAMYGGGLANSSLAATVTDCTFSRNSVEGWDSWVGVGGGGGVVNDCGSMVLTNCVFSGNSAQFGGGGMSNSTSSVTMTNCSFSGNTAAYGGAVLNKPPGETSMTSCILWGDTATDSYNEIGNVWYEPTPVTLEYSDIQGGCDAIADAVCGDGNIDADPQFIDAEDGDLRLQSTSPCIDMGSNDAVPDDATTDLDGNPRIVDGNADSTATVDMGAYEYQP